jgi:drug/metabolite transporter (DMT)-like permease
MEFYLWIILFAAIVYTLATMCMKRSSNAGIGPWRTTVVWNGLLALFSLPCWFVADSPTTLSSLIIPLLMSFGFFLGQLLNALAIQKGDVSLVTPIMGTKVVFVSILAIFFLPDAMGATVWVGTLLAAMGIMLMRGSNHTERKRLLPSILLGLMSAASFGAFDIVMQKFGSAAGYAEIVSRTFTFTFLWSLLLIPKWKSSIQKVDGRTWSWLLAGGLLHAGQAMILAYVLTTFGDATRVNIVYGSRAFWSIVLVWIIGHWFSNTERHLGKAVFYRRLAGSSFLVVAILLATWK